MMYMYDSQDALHTMIPKIEDLLHKHGDHSLDGEKPTFRHALHTKKLKSALGSDMQSMLTHSRGQWCLPAVTKTVTFLLKKKLKSIIE